MIVVSEIGDSHGYAHPRQLMAYLGLVPSESSSGGSRCQGVSGSDSPVIWGLIRRSIYICTRAL